AILLETIYFVVLVNYSNKNKLKISKDENTGSEQTPFVEKHIPSNKLKKNSKSLLWVFQDKYFIKSNNPKQSKNLE
ncbi:15148_t:CDS:1, partial [Gigaspora margarita]